MNEDTRFLLGFVAVVAFLLGMMAALVMFAAFDPGDDAPTVTATEFPEHGVVCFTTVAGTPPSCVATETTSSTQSVDWITTEGVVTADGETQCPEGEVCLRIELDDKTDRFEEGDGDD